MRTNPSLEAFEGELRKFMAIETEITDIPAVHNIGGCRAPALLPLASQSCMAPKCCDETQLRASSTSCICLARDGAGCHPGVPSLTTHTLHAVPAGSLSLESTPLKASLRAEAASWKAQFAQNLHKQCSEDLRSFDAYIRCAHVLGPSLCVPLWVPLSWQVPPCPSMVRSLLAGMPLLCVPAGTPP